MEAEKSHNTLSANRKDSSMVHFKTEGLRTKGAEGIILTKAKSLRNWGNAGTWPGVQRPEILEFGVQGQEKMGIQESKRRGRQGRKEVRKEERERDFCSM
jgi:hypothetical protein